MSDPPYKRPRGARWADRDRPASLGPRVFSYGRGSDYLPQAKACRKYTTKHLKAEYISHEVENWTDEAFVDRKAGAILQAIQPGEYLMAWKWNHMFNEWKDCFVAMRLAEAEKKNIVIVDSLYLISGLNDEELEKRCRTAQRLHHDVIYHSNPKQPVPIGWKEVDGEVVPNPAERERAIQICRECQKANLFDYRDVAEYVNQNKLWHEEIGHFVAENICLRARAKFPGPLGEIVLCNEEEGY